MTNILSGAGSAARGLAKGFIKGGMYLYDTVSDVASETGEHWNNLVAEARAQLAKPNGKPQAEKAEAVGAKDDDQSGNARKTRKHHRRSRGSK